MILKQDPDSYKSFFGLYGALDKECNPFNLSAHVSKIETVKQFMSDGKNIASYNGKVGLEYLNSFDSLECGKIYLLVLKPGSSSIDIPSLKVTTHDKDTISFTEDKPDYTKVREKEGYYYYSNKRMFKYKISQGTEYENNFHLEDIHRALDLWESIAWVDKSDYVHEVGIYFIDLVSEFNESYADVLAMASPEAFDKSRGYWEFGSTFPIYSQVLINTRNISYMKNIKDANGNTLYFNTIMHEIAHALGLNYYSMNEFMNRPIQSYVDENDNKTKFYYYGDNALREYRAYFPHHPNVVGIPLEDEVEAPRVSAHWEEGFGISRYINGVYHPALTTAMMTPFADETSTPLTKIIIGFLEDYGYKVDYTKANPFHK